MQDQQISSLHLKLEPENPKYIAAFVGELNGNIKLIEDKFSVRIFHKGNEIKIEGDQRLSKRPQIPFKIFMPTVVRELSYQVILFTPH